MPYLRANTCSYLWTKSTAGICSWTTFQDRDAGVTQLVTWIYNQDWEVLTIGHPHALEVEREDARVPVEIISNIYGKHDLAHTGKIGGRLKCVHGIYVPAY